MSKEPYEGSEEDRQSRRELELELKAAREEAGLSDRALATAAGTSPDHVSDIERGKVDAKLSTLQRLARAAGKTLVATILDKSDGTVVPNARVRRRSLVVGRVTDSTKRTPYVESVEAFLSKRRK